MPNVTHLAFGALSGTSFAGSPVTSTHALTLTNGTDTGIKFSVNAYKSGGGSPGVTAVTYNGVACTQVGVESAYGIGSPDGHFSEWWLARPDTGSSHNVVVTYSGTPSRVDIFWEEVENCHASTLPVQEAVYTGSSSSSPQTVAVSAPNTLGAEFATIVCFATRSTIWNANSPSDTTTFRQNSVSVGTTIPGKTLFTVASASTPYTANLDVTFTSGTSYYVVSVVRIPGTGAAATPRVLMIG